ncbi:hypothetical protein V3C99_008594 [Haemonchus contortus]
MGAALITDMSKSKSFLRSSSGTSYPYPRTHTTLMVVPSSRPIGPEESSTPRKQASRRRPPLNRSIPPIPESKSNESIMSHSSRRSSDKGDRSHPSECIVIENRNVVEPLEREPTSTSTSIPRATFHKRPGDQKKDQKTTRSAELTPRSPLMTVARTVKSKFSKLARIGRHEQDVSMKGSQSFSGIRQPKTTVPKRIDQNANRVIKSSSMEVPSTTQEASTSRHMVVIPQNPKRLEDFSEEASIADQGKVEDDVVMEDVPTVSHDDVGPLAVHHALSVTLNEDVLVITKQDDFTDHSDKTTTVLKLEERTSGTPGRVTIDEEHQTVHIYNEGDKIVPSVPQSPSQPSTENDADKGEMQSPEAEVAQVPLHSCLKTPQCVRKHHTFALGEKIPDTSSELRAVEHYEARGRPEVKESPEERELSPPTRFLITMKTPEALRKHKAFFIGQSDPFAKMATDESSQPRKKKPGKIIKQRSMPEKSSVSPERYILTVKTPEALRRHHTFTIRERPKSPDVPYIEEGEITEPIATVGPTADKTKKEKEKEEKREHEGKSAPNKLALALRTPFTMRKYKTFVVEEKPKEGVPSSKSADAIAQPRVDFTGHTEPYATPHTKRKQKATEDDMEREHQEKFILTTSTTPAMARKAHTFVIEDKPAVEEPVKAEEMQNSETMVTLEKQEELPEELPLKPSEMYVLTTMTPVPQRKEPIDSHLERIARDRTRSRSPDRVGLFIMKGRTTPRVPHQGSEEEISPKYAVVPPQRNELDLDTLRRERSQSDRAEFIERKNSDTSDEMTSPEEEIPMDTHLTPTEELRDDTLIIRPIRRPPEVTSPIAEEPEMSINGTPIIETKLSLVEGRQDSTALSDPPVFRPPSPPKETFKTISLSKSTSPLKRRGSSEISGVVSKDEKKRAGLSFRSKSEDRKEKKTEEKERLKREKREEKEKITRSPKMPITARSLRSAGKKLAPAFFRRGESKIPKPSKQVPPPSPMPTSKTRMQLPFRTGRRAPLAEFESSVVEDSPAVENNPLTFEKWSNSPRNKRRHSAHINGFAEPIAEESDGNGNPGQPITAPTSSRSECAMSPVMPRHEPAPGLIDDEILDQPMLVGDTFSHSESSDCLSAVRRMEFEAEKATLISIDRSLVDDDSLPRRTYDNGNGPPPNTARAATVFTGPPLAYRKALEDGLSEVDDIRSQLEKLQLLVSQEMRGTEMEKLIRENEALRRELVAKDDLISSLRQQIASQRRET